MLTFPGKNLVTALLLCNGSLVPAKQPPSLQIPVSVVAVRSALTTIPPDTMPSESVEPLTIYFFQSDYHLRPEETRKLDQLISKLANYQMPKIRIVGHTDNVGNAERNVILSEFRARIIRRYLMANHIPEQHIYWIGVGSKYPVSENDSEENKRKNRRVEITLLP